MADWYVSSGSFAAVSAFAASHAYSIGDLVKSTTAAAKSNWVFRCTTAGTSSTEPTWSTAPSNNQTITSGGATFTNVTGQSTYFWTAAAGDFGTLQGAGSGSCRYAAGDRVFVASDHSETQTSGTRYGGYGSGLAAGYGLLQMLCVNRAGSTPPVAADLTTGATMTYSSANMIIDAVIECYHYGITYAVTGVANIQIASSGYKTNVFDNCQLFLNTANAGSLITSGNPTRVVLNATTARFGATGQSIEGSNTYLFELEWRNTPSAIAGATIPTILFQGISTGCMLVTCRGVDLSAITGTLWQNTSSGGNPGGKFLLDSCRIASGVTRYATGNTINTADQMDLVNCYNGSVILSESYQPGGSVTTETTITLSGGATDNVGTFSHKMVSNANVDKLVAPLAGFWLDVNNTLTTGTHTASVEIISSATLNNDECWLYLEYEGTSGSSLASFASSQPATVLTSNAAITSSSATWNSSPATPQKQTLSVSFTPRQAGRLRGQVRLGKASTTCYYNPQITVT